MHYQTRLLPTGDQGQFLLAICHGEHKIGGEDTRETAYTRFATGQLPNTSDLRDLTAQCVLPRPASAAAAAYELRMATGQGELARSGQYSPALSASYLQNERSMRHSGALAALPGVRVPRLVHASRAGHLLLGFEPSLSGFSGEVLPGVMCLLNVADGTLMGKWSSNRAPLESPRRGLERFSNVQLGRPLAISRDGRHVLLLSGRNPQDMVTALCLLDDDLTEVARAPERVLRWTSLTQGWLAASHEELLWLSAELVCEHRRAVPAGAVTWSMVCSADGAVAAVGMHSAADFLLLSRDSTKPRRFSPHRGARKDGYMTLAMSECGGWVTTRWKQELVLTRVADGVSWPVAKLIDQNRVDASHDAYEIRSQIPAAFNFLGTRLVVCHDGIVREISMEEVAQSFVSEHGRPGARIPLRVKRSMTTEQLLRAARLQSHAALLAPLASPALVLRSKALKQAGWRMPAERSNAPMGSSRLGGWPDLPPDQPWPTWEERPMAFLAQINLAEAHAAEPALRLPKTGLLSFFLGCSNQTYRNEKHRRDSFMVDLMAGTESKTAAWCVLHHPELEHVQRRQYIENPAPQLFEPCSLRMQRGGLPLPDERTAIYPLLTQAMSTDQCDDYNELISQLQPDDEANSCEQLMGYPQLIQGTPPEMMCELSIRGRNPWQYPAPEDPDFAELSAAAGEWALLLQLTSNSPADFCWGDGGHFYFYGKREAMERGDFSQMWVNFEN